MVLPSKMKMKKNSFNLHDQLVKDSVFKIGSVFSVKGKDIIVYGGGTFVTSLIKAGLIDEFHLFIQEHFGRFLAEGRKYNFSFNFAGHSFALLDTMFRAMVLRCHAKVILGNDGDDAQILSKSLQITASDIINLKPFHAISRIGNKNFKIQLFRPPLTFPIQFSKPERPIQEELCFLGDEWISIT